jgi:hypothetical protein
MKNLFLCVLLFSTVALATKALIGKKAQNDSCTYSSTLNGVPDAIALKRIAYFEKYKGIDQNTGKAASIWFKKSDIENINTLLTAESDNSIPENERVDGVRFYFACDSPINGATKLKLSIYLVSTRPQDNTGQPKKSAHGDYYCHTASYLGAGKFGEETYDTNIPGYGLYGVPVGGYKSCQNEPSNYVDEATAYNWVTKFRYAKPDPIVTESEWFPRCFIQFLFQAIQDENSIGGLRVYLAMGENKHYPGMLKDILLLVPTYADKTDYYGCVGDVEEFPKDCDTSMDKWFANIKNIYSPEWRKSKHPKLTKLQKYPFMYGGASGGGYDNGELCPDVCNKP